ncbi:MAG: DUF58 domain-containing protein [Theionarchaea archaeon]|nr:DUF58 domain-containing protein [Theionarchaea archaeon]MBU7000032.1 DUF58 domain-containing protein [Theionarchaea archaeon]MBU7021670.1 DUF58 domain-containing protein [Theionarchaea archaeon]MBU7034682.1 DUF58 domain-containing protein [Theionarchaea archaeon]MBU7039343.1 DUF58 domain-containing protein [Theionarchaea archaeon]
MYSSKVFAILGIALLFFVLGILLKLPPLLFISLPFMMYLILSSAGCPRAEFVVERGDLPARMLAGDSTAITLSVRLSQGRVPHLMEIRDTVNTGPDAYFMVRGEPLLSLQYRRGVKRGFLEVGPTTLCLSNFSRTVFSIAECPDSARVTVLPRVHPVRVGMSPRFTTSFHGPIPSHKAGAGEEFYALRNYLPGDGFRTVNWKATARRATLISNEFEAERVSEAILVIDASNHTGIGEAKSLLDYELDVAASIARFLLAQGHRVGAFIYSDYFHWISPGTTHRHFIKMLDVFAAISPAGFHRTQYAAAYVSAYARGGSQVIIISSCEDPGALDAVLDLRAAGLQVMVLSPSPESIEWQEISHTRYAEAARALLQKERRLTFSQLNALCRAVDWDVSCPLEDILKKVEPWLRNKPR